jgi:hypothetical protein
MVFASKLVGRNAMTEQLNKIFLLDKQTLHGQEQISPQGTREINRMDLKSNLQKQSDNAINILSVSAAVLFLFLFIWFLSISA